MHLLDLLMYFVLFFVIWKLMGIWSEDMTEGLGAVTIGMPIMVVYTIIYVILFAIYPDWNWVDINFNVSEWFVL